MVRNWDFPNFVFHDLTSRKRIDMTNNTGDITFFVAEISLLDIPGCETGQPSPTRNELSQSDGPVHHSRQSNQQ